MTDSKTNAENKDNDKDEQHNNRLPFQSVVESDSIWLCIDALQSMTREFEDQAERNTETINKHLRDAQISLQQAKTAQRQALIYDRVYSDVQQDELTIDEYETDTETDTNIDIEFDNETVIR